MTDVEERGLFIDGKFGPSESGATFPVFNPHTDEVFSKVALAGEADAEAPSTPPARRSRARGARSPRRTAASSS